MKISGCLEFRGNVDNEFMDSVIYAVIDPKSAYNAMGGEMWFNIDSKTDSLKEIEDWLRRISELDEIINGTLTIEDCVPKINYFLNGTGKDRYWYKIKNAELEKI